MSQKVRTNPRTSRTTTESLYRGVSPGEYADIIRSGRITGRGNLFSGDPRCSFVFFGREQFVGMRDVVRSQGEDVTRYVGSLPEIVSLAGEVGRLEAELWRVDKQATAFWYKGETAEVREKQKEYRKAVRLLDTTFRQLEVAHKVARRRAGLTSLVLRLDGVRGGTLFTEGDSFHATDEVGFKRARGVKIAKHLAKVYVYDENGLRAELEGGEALDLEGPGGKLLALAEAASTVPGSGRTPGRRRNPMNIVTFILWDTIGRDVAKHVVKHVKKRVNGALRRRNKR